jgi:peptide deformylase
MPLLIPFNDIRLTQVSARATLPAHALAQDLCDALRSSKTGAGLAAPQLGILEAVFVFWPNRQEPVRVVCNPRILSRSAQTEVAEEGCLSFPNTYIPVERSKQIEVEYQDAEGGTVHGTLNDFAARVFQHEYDHLQGVTIVDKLPPHQREQVLAAHAKRLRKAGRMGKGAHA